jgi:iron complex transport system substrate-binding protein
VRIALPLIAIPLLLAGCASPAIDTAATPSAVTVDNCGFELTVTTPPERIVTIKSTSTDMLVALGLEDRIIGQAFPDGDPGDVPVISDFAPSEEAVLDLEPDFVFGGWESNFTAEAAGDRAELKTLGIGSYVSPAACKEPGYKPDPLTWDGIFDDIAEAGAIFGAPDEAAALVAEQKAELAAITPDVTGRTALWWSSGNDTPYVGAGKGAPQLVLDTIGLTNIAASVDDTWTSYTWEAIIAANPDVIVLVDATWNTAAAKVAFLESDPAAMNLDAVKNKRYLYLPFAAGEAGVRSVSAATDLAAQLADLG